MDALLVIRNNDRLRERMVWISTEPDLVQAI